jgi:hypothetical protein
MKLMTLILSAVFTLSIANAGELKDNMKLIGSSFKQISSTINDSSKNADNIALVEKMLVAFKASRAQAPTTVTASTLADYQSLIDTEIKNLTDLEAALKNNDNAAALALLQKINTTKKEGHDKYKD